MKQNIPIAQLSFGDDTSFAAPVDTGTPLVVVDRGGSLAIQNGEVRLRDGTSPDVTRFIFHKMDVLDLRLQPVGLGGMNEIGGIIGASLLRHFALHLTYASSPSMTLKDEIPDTSAMLAGDCDVNSITAPDGSSPVPCIGVFSLLVVGGGLSLIGDEQIELPPTRLVVPLCLMPQPFDPSLPPDPDGIVLSGVPLMAMVATGMSTSVISRPALERLRVIEPSIVERPAPLLGLPYGIEQVSMVTIDRIALVSDHTIKLGPCGELAFRRRLLLSGQQGVPEEERDKDGASVAELRLPLDFAVMGSDRPLLYNIGNEIGPYAADVDVILGSDFLKSFEVDVDYPAPRLILQCAEVTSRESCAVIPFCSHSETPLCPGVERP